MVTARELLRENQTETLPKLYGLITFTEPDLWLRTKFYLESYNTQLYSHKGQLILVILVLLNSQPCPPPTGPLSTSATLCVHY